MDCSLLGFSVHGILQQEYWSGLPFTSPGDLPNTEIEPRAPALQADSPLSEPPGKPLLIVHFAIIVNQVLMILLVNYTFISLLGRPSTSEMLIVNADPLQKIYFAYFLFFFFHKRTNILLFHLYEIPKAVKP